MNKYRIKKISREVKQTQKSAHPKNKNQSKQQTQEHKVKATQ